MATGKELRRLRGDLFEMNLLAVSPDGKLLALGAGGKAVVLVDAGTGKEVRRLESDSRASLWAAFSHDARTLVVVGFDLNAHFWDVATGKELRKVPFLQGPRTRGSGPHCAPALSPDGKLIAFGGGRNHFIALRDLTTGKEVR